ncbi:RmlC-like cupin [Saccharata proteae CBS 121410]|uniref:RmlC-like cupin n=1 Tax=Saccharata proteae CBS 121410 TaxID=1314787 RepID=A0A9P4LV56_9PEZI|nr:RmlC-like cupin [Saccharata proteae CBS 121410]
MATQNSHGNGAVDGQKQQHVPRLSQPPPSNSTSYVIPQFEGELISIPGSKSVFRVLTSAVQTDDAFSVFSSGGVLADAPGFHHHEGAHDIFIVTKGFIKLWSGDRCKVLGPGDFGSVPPGIIHNPQTLGPYTESFGLITPGAWIDFFRHVCETYTGIQLPEHDDRNLASILIPKVMSAPPGKFDVHFHPHHQGCAVSEWGPEDEVLPDAAEPYYLRANTGPRWLLGGVMSRPFITTKQSEGRFAISSIESSNQYETSALGRSLVFPNVHHCFTVFEGKLEILIGGTTEPCLITEGETLFVPAGVAFSLCFKSKYVRFWSFASGDGIEAVVHEAGKKLDGFVLPDKVVEWDDGKVTEAYKKLNVEVV